MSVQRSFAQRNNNVVNMVPEKATNDLSPYWNDRNAYLLKIDPRHASVFNIDVTVLDTGNNYSRSNRIDHRGILHSEVDVPKIETALIIDPTIASAYPGLEFTINFINTDYNLEDEDTSVSVCLTATLTGNRNNIGEDVFIISPIYGYNYSIIQSITLKSIGQSFTVISSGKAPWFQW